MEIIISNSQFQLSCCGVHGPDDYNNLPLPVSCCVRTINNECLRTEANHDGCADSLTRALVGSAQLVGGVAIGIAAVEVSNFNLVCCKFQLFLMEKEKYKLLC